MSRSLYPANVVGLHLAFWLVIVSCGKAVEPELSPSDPRFRIVHDVMKEQCVDCHDEHLRKGGVELTRFQSANDADRDRPLWKAIFDVVEAGQMPLPGSGYELTREDRQVILDYAREILARPDPVLGVVDPGKPILRRLTRLEYNNTVRDLFKLDVDLFMFPERLPITDKRYFTQQRGSLGGMIETSMREYGQKVDVLLPQTGLPGDNRAEHGYAGRGDALNFSPLLLEKYLELASAIAFSERLVRESPVMQELLGIDPRQRKPASSVELKEGAGAIALSPEFASRERIGQQATDNDTWHNSFVAELTSAYERGSGGTFDVPKPLNNQTVPGKGGLIKLRLGSEVLTINPNVDLWLASFATAQETSGDLLLTNRVQGEKVFELTFGGEGGFRPEIEQLGICVLARKKQHGNVRLTAILSNGQRIDRSATIAEDAGNTFFSWVAPPNASIVKLAIDGSQYSGEYVLLDDLGVIVRNGDLRSPASPFAEQEVARPAPTKLPPYVPQPLPDRLSSFIRRAYRRPITDAEREAAFTFVESQQASGLSEQDAIKRWVQSILTSSEFLFLAEPTQELAAAVRPLESHELACRLSYFLWSSMPDDELLELSESGQLRRPEVLRGQIQRMCLDRSRSRELSESFAVQWLRLDQLYSSKPDRQKFARFYSGPQGKSTLHGPMMIEALLLFETVLAEDRSVLDLLDPDFTWLNQQLAELYGLQDEFEAAKRAAGDQPAVGTTAAKSSDGKWYRTIVSDRRRGGVMTMAGPLVLTSLPSRTSPIKRGAWLLETIFNRPPPEPKVAFVLEEVSAAQPAAESPAIQTIRQKFEQHRRDPNCTSCHSRIDPPGFSLEVFDAIGSLRTHEGTQPVDATGSWNGVEFDGPAEFKKAMLTRKEELVRGFVEHLMSYALGRKLEHFDRASVDTIVAEVGEDDNRLSAIIEKIVESYPFQHVRNGK